MEINTKKDIPLSVVFTIDERFVQHFAVTLVSLLENNSDLKVTVYVIHDIENNAILSDLAAFFRDGYGTELKLIKVDNSIFTGYRISLHYSKAVYFRLLITEILPPFVDNALFLDADVVVAGSLRELAAHQFNDNEFLLAVDDVEVVTHVKRLNDMGFPVTRYFNAGVLLINVKAWRINRLSNKFIDMANQYMERLAWWDQDILNMYFYNDWQAMDPKFNAIHLTRKLSTPPAIIHYAGTAKPWLYIHEHPYKQLYWDYIKLTPFKNYQYPDRTLKEWVRKYYIKVLDILKLRQPAMSKD